MDKHSVVCIHSEVLFSYKDKWNNDIYRKMGGAGDHFVKPNKPDWEKTNITYSLMNWV